jgi:hypothetical protein
MSEKRSEPETMFSGRQARFCSLAPEERSLLVRTDFGIRLAVAKTAALQQKNLPALCALPGKHAEFRVHMFLQKPMASHAGQLHLGTIGTGFFSLAHRLPLEEEN